MKRMFCILLSLILTLSLCACGGETAQPAETFPETTLELGFGRADITPEDSVPMYGYADTVRESTETHDPLTVTCLFMKDGDATALLFTQDINYTTNTVSPDLRQKLCGQTGVAQENISFASTGTYGGPDIKNTADSVTAWKEKYTQAVLEAARIAQEDLAPAVLYTAETEVEGLSFVHHYTMADGSVEDGYYGVFDQEITGHAADHDKTMRIVKVARKDAADVILVNWQSRANVLGSREDTVITADYPGAFRNALEAKTGAKVAYFNGACGEISPRSRIESEEHGLGLEAYGEKLAQFAFDALPNIQPLAGTGVECYRAAFFARVNHRDEDKMDDAKKVVALRATDGDAAADKLARELNLHSVWNAAILSTRATRPETRETEQNGMRFGGLGFAPIPCNIFSLPCETLREDSPFEMTFVLSEANEAWPCIPSKEAFDYGCYEADVSYYAQGAAERMAEISVDLLEMVK